MKFKVKRDFVHTDMKKYTAGQPILLENEMEIHRMMVFGIIHFKKKPDRKSKLLGRKPKLERAVTV